MLLPHRAYQPLPTDDTESLSPLVGSGKKPHDRGLHGPPTRLLRVLSYLAAMLAVVSLVHFLCPWVRPGSRVRDSCDGLEQGDGTVLLPSLPSHYTLPSGDKIPSVALGVWQAKPDEVGNAIKVALGAGYRHIDGAWAYGNEAEVGRAIEESSVPREEMFITTKLWNSFHAPEDIEPTLDDSLEKLRTDYLDLYLIHWPVAFKKEGHLVVDEALTEDPYPTWKKLEELVDKGKIRNIGISNFNVRRIQNLTANPLKYRPAVNQVELNYWNPQPELVKWAKEHDLLLEAYSPLGGNRQVGRTLAVREVREIACKHGITPAQVIISWHVQRGTVVLPKSVTPSRIVENHQVFELPREDFDKLETAASKHPPERTSNPSKRWGLSFDVFDGE